MPAAFLNPSPLPTRKPCLPAWPRAPPFTMLSAAARTALRQLRAGRLPALPSRALPRSARLYLEPESLTAVAHCRRRSRFARRNADALLAALRPLREQDAFQSFVIAVEGGGGVAAAAREVVERAGGSVVDGGELWQAWGGEKSGADGRREEEGNVEVKGLVGEVEVDAEDTCRDVDTNRVREEEKAEEGEKGTRLRALSTVRREEARKKERRRFELCADHLPAGDQPNAIRFLADGLLRSGKEFQTLHGVTGSGKTFIMANVIAKVNRPTLILAPNKTLAAQLCNELASHFPKNRVEFFVSHFKFYQPEAYLPQSDKYIAKASAVDPDIDRLRHAATRSLFERNDTIVVASVSSIYGLGLPTEYLEASIRIQLGDRLEGGVGELVDNFIQLNYIREDDKMLVARGSFRVSSTGVDLAPPWEPEGTYYKFDIDGDTIVRMENVETKSGNVVDLGDELVLYPAKHFVTPKDRLEAAILRIEEETRRHAEAFRSQGKPLEASRLEERVTTDMEMMRKVGFCSGAENYSLYLSGRAGGTDPGPPETLLDYMPQDGKWLLFIDESHVTVPQLGAMHAGNAARKRKLVRHGFRLPSAMENRPLSADEFWHKTHQTVFVSATPGTFELEKSGNDGTVEAVIRPTGVVDPKVDVVGTKGQIEHLTLALAQVAASGGKAIVTTLTKRFAEDLSDCIANKPAVAGTLGRPLRVSFLHSGIDSVGRMQVLEAMRGGGGAVENEDGPPSELDVVVGVNLLREGIDLPNVRLVAILDADAEGFLRGETALVQTIGRAARNVDGHVIMYADTMTSAMHRAIAETSRRRRLQMAYNSLYNITPTGVGFRRSNSEEERDTLLNRIRKLKLQAGEAFDEKKFGGASEGSLEKVRTALRTLKDSDDMTNVDSVRSKMLHAAHAHDFETAALLRDCLVKMEASG